MLVAKRNQDVMPSLLNELLNWNTWSNEVAEAHATPKMNVSESETDYQLELLVPGLSKDDLRLSIDSDNTLIVELAQHEQKEENEQPNRRYIRREFSQLQFKKLLSLPDNVKKEAISANVENGILIITLPKFTEQEKQNLLQRIEIK